MAPRLRKRGVRTRNTWKSLVQRRVQHLHFFKAMSAAPNEPVAGATSLVTTDIPLNLAEGELWLIRRALAKAGGNISEAARLLGTHRNRIYRALAEQEHALQPVDKAHLGCGRPLRPVPALRSLNGSH